MLSVLDMDCSYKELVYCMKKICGNEDVEVPSNLLSFYTEVSEYLKSNSKVTSNGFDFKFKKPNSRSIMFCSRGCESVYLKSTLKRDNVDFEEVFCFPTIEQKEFGKHGIRMEHEEFSLIVLGLYLGYSNSIFGVEYENPEYILDFFQGDTFCSKEFRDIVNKHFSKFGYTIEYPMIDTKTTKIDAYRYLIKNKIEFQPCDSVKPCCHCYKCAEYFWHFDALGYRCPIRLDKDFLKNIVRENKVLMESKNDKYDSFTTWNQLESLNYRKWYEDDNS